MTDFLTIAYIKYGVIVATTFTIVVVIRYRYFLLYQREVSQLIKMINSGNIDDAIKRCQEKKRNPYLATFSVAFNEFQTGKTPEYTFLKIRKIGIQNLDVLNYFDRALIMTLLITIIVFTLASVHQASSIRWVGISSLIPSENVGTQLDLPNPDSKTKPSESTSNDTIDETIIDREEAMNYSLHVIGTLESLVVNLSLLSPLLFWSFILISTIILEPTRHLYIRLQWYSTVFLEQLYNQKEKWNYQRNLLEKIYSSKWNWTAFFLNWLWYFIKGMFSTGLVLLLLGIGITVISLILSNVFLFLILHIPINFYCGIKGNSHLYAKRKKLGRPLVDFAV